MREAAPEQSDGDPKGEGIARIIPLSPPNTKNPSEEGF